MTKIGTLAELNVKPGDVVAIYNAFRKGTEVKVTDDFENWCGSNEPWWRLISRAAETPKLWRDMTPEEKGALLLAHHEGKVIEQWDGFWGVSAPVEWLSFCAYRIKPEPKVETVVMGILNNANGWQGYAKLTKVEPTHRITFNTIDGKPDCASVKMEPLK